MKKIFTLLTLALMSVGTAWGADETILSFSGGTLTGATAVYTESGTLESGKYKLAGTDATAATKYVQLTLNSGTFQTGDKISITYYASNTSKAVNPGLFFGTITGEVFTSALTLQAGSSSAGSSSPATVNTLTVTAEGNGTNVLRLTRYSGGTTLYITALTITRESSKTASDLAIVEGKGTKILGVDDTYTLTKGTDFTTSCTGAFTYTSGDEDIATVTSGGLITAKAVGSTTITVTQASDATYLGGNVVFTVNVNSAQAQDPNMVTPSSTLDLTDASAASALLNGTWHDDYGRPLFGNDGSNNYMVYPLVAAYSSAGDTKQAWIGNYNLGSSNDDPWDATGVFVGSAAYNMKTVKRANLGSGKVLSFRVKGVKKAQLLADTRGTSKKVYMSAYEVTAGTPASTTIVFESLSTASEKGTLTLNLDAAKEYVIALTSANDSRLYEMALFYDETVALYEAITPAKEFTTYVTKNAVDFTGLGLKAYVATAASATAVTLAEVTTVPAGTPLVLEGTASTTYNVPFVATSSAPASNLLVAGDGKTTIGGDGKYDYVLKDGLFYHASSGKVPVGKAYLHLEADPATSRGMELSLDFGGGVTGISEIEDVRSKKDDVYYDLNGRRVLYPTKGLYIMNGKKVIVK